MKFWGPPSTIERREEPGELIFIVQPQRYIFNAVILALVAGGLLGAWLGLVAGVVSGLLIGVGAYFWSMQPANPITLIAREDTVAVRTSDSSDVYRWPDIIQLEYIAGGEDSPSGLGVKQSRWKSKVILNCVNSAQSNEIIAAINERFPSLSYAPAPPPILESIFGHKKKSDEPHSDLAPPDRS